MLTSDAPEQTTIHCERCRQDRIGFLYPNGCQLCPVCDADLFPDVERSLRRQQSAAPILQDPAPAIKPASVAVAGPDPAAPAAASIKPATQPALKKKTSRVPAYFITAIVLFGCYLHYDCYSPQTPLYEVIADDPRNSGITASSHYDGYFSRDYLVIDLLEVRSSRTKLDVFRVLLQFAAKMKNKRLDLVRLDFKSERRFYLTGAYFQTLGQEYDTQNPTYTMRTFPENVLTLDGKQAFSTWTGGILGVYGKQLEDFNTFFEQWLR